MVTWPMTSLDSRRCCEVVRSAILARAWLLVLSVVEYRSWPHLSSSTDVILCLLPTYNTGLPCSVEQQLMTARNLADQIHSWNICTSHGIKPSGHTVVFVLLNISVFLASLPRISRINTNLYYHFEKSQTVQKNNRPVSYNVLRRYWASVLVKLLTTWPVKGIVGLG